MADNFGLKIGLEGEKEFKKALNEINQSFKVLGSEMKLVQSAFDKNDNSVEALTARNQVLNKEIEAQKQKIETLRAALANAAESFGENDRRTQSWQIQLNNATAALNDMERELSQNNDALKTADREMDDVSDSADDMGEEIDDAGDAADKSKGKFESLTGVLKGVGVALAAVATAAAAAAVKLGKEVVSAYGEYEQLVGGVDTLFKESSQELQAYAANAYKTAGMSANEYMETVTSFSASLIQSLGGDTAEAVKYADMAITDMSDNANKMGTDMGLIQNAYQGFAKQNYTMLDNLKLGYGGTKTEMERLLADAQALTGIEYNIDSFADVVSAIHVIQESMGIAGATAAEAEDTIEGSINSFKAALQNMLVGFGDANSDMTKLTNNMVSSLKTVIKNITPVLQNIVKVLPTVADALLQAVAELLPTLLESVTDLFEQLLNTIITLMPELIPAVVDGLLAIVDAIVENLPLFVEVAVQAVVSVANGITKAIPKLIPSVLKAIQQVCKTLIENLPLLLNAVLELIKGLAQGIIDAIPVIIEALPELIQAVIDFLLESIPQIIDTGIQLFTALVAALPTIIEAIVAAIPQIIDSVIDAVLDAIPLIIDAGVKLLTALIGALPDIIVTIVAAIPQIIESVIQAIIDAIPQIIEAGITLLTSLVAALPDIIIAIVEAIPEIIDGIIQALLNSIPQLIEAGVTLFTSLIANLPTIIVELVKAVPQIITGLVEAFGKGIGSFVEIGANMVRGLWEGIKSLASWLWDKVSNWASNLWNGILDFFGIHSPSKKMAWVGDMMMEGLASGIDESAGEAIKSASDMTADLNSVFDDLSADLTTALPQSIDVNAVSAVGAVGENAGGGFVLQLNITNFNNYSAEDITELTNEVMQTAGEFIKRKGVTFA